jgi:hypothetical protein
VETVYPVSEVNSFVSMVMVLVQSREMELGLALRGSSLDASLGLSLVALRRSSVDSSLGLSLV